MSTITVLYRSISEADVEELLNDSRSSAMSRGDQFEVRDTLQARVDQLTEQNRELVLQLRDALSQMTRAAESISEGRYDEALLHCASMHRPKLEAIRKATGEE